MRTAPARPFPFVALVEWFGDATVNRNNGGEQHAVAQTLAELLGVNRRTVSRWQRDGLCLNDVELVTAKLGALPELLWPVEWSDVEPEWVWEDEPAGWLFGARPDVPMGRKHRCARDGCRCQRARRKSAVSLPVMVNV